MDNICFRVKHIRWNDYGWKTHYHLTVKDKNNKVHDVGRILIVNPKDAMEYDTIHYNLEIPREFYELGKDIITVGVGKEYYENIYKISLEIDDFQNIIKERLNDISLNNNAEQYKNEIFYKDSFTRHNSHFAICNNYKRLSRMGKLKKEYNLSFNYEWFEGTLNIKTKADNILPDNIYGIIGRNGSGKTRLLNDIMEELVSNNESYEINKLLFTTMSSFDKHSFLLDEKVKYISIFDDRDSNNILINRKDIIRRIYDSMQKISVNLEKTKDLNYVTGLFKDQFEYEFDFLFEKLFENAKANIEFDNLDIENNFPELNILSSGQIYLLYVLTTFTAEIEENMFAVIDELELYLHPPYIMIYINLLSFLFEKRNAIAFIATHSPIVIQQIPSECVYELKKDREKSKLQKINFPCYGENLSLINDRIFDISSSESGFYRELSRLTYEQLQEVYNNHSIGIEAKVFIKSTFKKSNKELKIYEG
ncbi:hypothetical protein [Macrococcus animalis]|uniref:hypothetical protein n=1 Tax=Macrococcus animalis TaxID=3395467 RepID=UPI0039BDCDF3